MLEQSYLYKRWAALVANFGGDPGLAHTFAKLRATIAEQSKIIIVLFPEYTPHDAARHLEHLFDLADRVLGPDLYDKLNLAEISLLVFGLYAHDWGMAVSADERDVITGSRLPDGFVLTPDEVNVYRHFHHQASATGRSEVEVWEDYVRETHALRSGYRLRAELRPLGQPFSEMVARVAEGHVLDFRDIRNPEQYPQHTALFGEVANVAAVATFVRMVDLLDLAEDRTPFALWSVVRPRNEISRIEWSKHRALAPVAVSARAGIRQILITGTTDDPDVFAALADLRSWVDPQFGECIGFLRSIGNQYDPMLDSAIEWTITPVGFQPVLLRFEFDRAAALGLLSAEIYGSDRLTFVRELLQNSVDAIDTRVELLRQTDTPLKGKISVKIATLQDAIQIKWTDNGVGMDRYVLENYLTKIGRSWYQSTDFRRHGLRNDPISKFGIGLLSCFAVSGSLTVYAKREPSLARDFLTWHVRIADRERYFRVRAAADQTPVGTTIILDLSKSSGTLTATKIAAAVRRIAVLVNYSIALELDGSVELIEPISEGKESRLPYLRFSSLDENAIASLQRLTIQFNHRYRAPDGSYEAYFSCLLPRDLNSLNNKNSSRWGLGAETLDFDELITESPDHILFKGIASDTERKSDVLRIGDSSALAVNILKPSLVRPNLSRSEIQLHGIKLNEVWDDVAVHLRHIFSPYLESPDDSARALSAALDLARIPENSLRNLAAPETWPIWVLESGHGLSWRSAASIFSGEEILEAPDELKYVFGSEDRFYAALREATYWHGPSCFLALRRYSYGQWWAAAARLAVTFLEIHRFVPVGIRLLHGADGDSVPLVCRVWRKQTNPIKQIRDLDASSLLAEWRASPTMVYPDLLRSTLPLGRNPELNAIPDVVRFPDDMNDVAAIGSLYWNQNNKKIQHLVEFLLEFSDRLRRGQVSGRTQQIFDHVNDASYLGYVVGARRSSFRAAIGRYEELLKAVKQDGFTVPDPITQKDFFPDSVGEYRNPYHYPIWSWVKSKTPIGTPWDSTAPP